MLLKARQRYGTQLLLLGSCPGTADDAEFVATAAAGELSSEWASAGLFAAAEIVQQLQACGLSVSRSVVVGDQGLAKGLATVDVALLQGDGRQVAVLVSDPDSRLMCLCRA